MATYIMLSRLTDEGRATLKERPERLQEVNRELEAMGAAVRLQFALLGRYDFINVVEAPDNETISRISVELSSRGTVQLQTLIALPIDPAAPRRRIWNRGRVSTFVALTRLTPEGRKALQSDAGRLAEIDAGILKMGATITRHFRTLGEYDFVSFAEAPDNGTAMRVATEVSSLGTVRVNLYPAIAIDRFLALLRMKAYRTEPHAWQTQLWSRVLRRIGRYWVLSRHVKRHCQPLTTTGREHLAGVPGPAIIIANHTSHFDTPVALTALPEHLRSRTAIAAAADRFYRTNKRTWWFSLFWNTFPIARGGGKAALDYPMSLLGRGWSILIYPEGGRFKAGRVQRFHHGVTVMAMQGKVPVIPIFLDGLQHVMPKGTRTPRPGPVTARLGAPVSLEGIASVPEGTLRLENAMRALGELPERS